MLGPGQHARADRRALHDAGELELPADNLAVLNMIPGGCSARCHCHCAHSHDCIDHWFWDTDGTPRWPAKYLSTTTATSIRRTRWGRCSVADINCGDAFKRSPPPRPPPPASTPTLPAGSVPTTPGQGGLRARDIVTSVVKTHRGKASSSTTTCSCPGPKTTLMVQARSRLRRGSEIRLRPRPQPKDHTFDRSTPPGRVEHAW